MQVLLTSFLTSEEILDSKRFDEMQDETALTLNTHLFFSYLPLQADI